MNRRRTDERGSMALELAMLAPVLLALLGLIFAYGKTSQINGLLEAGTRDAARSATNARSVDDARQVADQALKAALSTAPQSCQSSAKATLTGSFAPGAPITVTGHCRYSLSDAGIPGVGFSVSPTSAFTSMLDPNRGLD